MTGAAVSAGPSLETLHAEMQIRHIISIIAHMADCADEEHLRTVYADCWAEDALWEARHNAMRGGGYQTTRRGRADIIAGALERLKSGWTGPGSNTMHVIGTHWIKVEGSLARALSNFVYLRRDGTQIAPVTMGVYDDEFRNEGGVWRIARRRLMEPGTMPEFFPHQTRG